MSKISERELIVRVPGGWKISEEKAKQISELKLPGILIAEDSKRHYPKGAFASHILGFTTIDNQGLSGIERVYDDMLKGQRGSIEFYADAKGKPIPGEIEKFTPPKDGLNLYLTLDANIQAIIERELDQAFAMYDPDDALVIAMDPKTGEILGCLVVQTTIQNRFVSIRQKFTIEIYLSGKHMSQDLPLKLSPWQQPLKKVKSI